jgi:hypothetical protein
LALVGVPFFAGVSVLPAPIETKAATSYIDVGSGLDSLTIGSFYMFGAYAEESGTPYVYLLSNPAKGGYVRVPCLSKTDASHPCGIVPRRISLLLASARFSTPPTMTPAIALLSRITSALFMRIRAIAMPFRCPRPPPRTR